MNICFLKYRNVICGKHKASKSPFLSQALGTVIPEKNQIWPLRVLQLKKAVRNINNLLDCVKCNNGDIHSISWEHQKKDTVFTCDVREVTPKLTEGEGEGHPIEYYSLHATPNRPSLEINSTPSN